MANDLTVRIGADLTDFHRGMNEVSRSAKGLGQTVQSAFGSVVSGLGKIGLAGLGVQALTSSVRGLGDAIGLGLNSAMEDVEAQLLAFTKDGRAAKNILAQIRAEADKTPFGFQEMAIAVSGLMPAARQAGEELMSVVKDAEILAASNPAQGLEGAAFALREAVSGDFTSIIERFNLPRSYINKLKEEGVPALEIVRQTMKAVGYDSDMVGNLAKTASGKWSTLMDTFDSFRLKLSEPIFERVKAGLTDLQTWLDENKDSIDRWVTTAGTAMAQAADMSGRLAGSIGNLSQTAAPALKLVADNILWLAAAVTTYLGVQAVGALVAWGSATVTAVSYQLALFRMMGLGTAIMNTWIGSVLRGAASLVTFAVSGISSALTGLSQFVTMLARNAVAALASFAVAVYTRAVAALVVFATTGIRGVITAGVSLIASLGRQAVAFAATGAASVVAAGRMMAAWVTTAVPAIISGAAAVATAIAGVAVPLLAVAAVVGAFALAWQTNFGNIQEIVTNVVNWIGERLNDLFGWLKSLPVVGKYFKDFGDWMGSAGRTIGKAMGGAGKAIEDLIADAKEGFPAAQKALKEFLGLDFEPAVLGMGDFRVQTEGLGDAIEGAGDAASQFSSDASPMKSALDSLKERANTLKDALSTAKDRLRELINTPLTGERAFDDKSFAIQQKINALRLKITNLKIAGAKDRTIKPFQDQLEKLQLQSEKIDLEKALKYDPLHRKLQQLGEDYKELPFGKVVQGIQAQKTEIGLLTPKISILEDTIKSLERSYKNLTDAVTGASAAISKMPAPGVTAGASTVTPQNYGIIEKGIIDSVTGTRTPYQLSAPAPVSVNYHAPLIGNVAVSNEADEDRLVGKLQQLLYSDLKMATGQGVRA